MNYGTGTGDFTGLSEAERWLSIAERLLGARDLEGSKRFAERAVEANPLVDAAADRIIAAADVLLASQRHFNNHLDWYAVLQIEPTSSPSAVLHQYRRLAIVLRPSPDGNFRDPTLDSAFAYASKLVEGAWTVLSDPQKRALYNSEVGLASSAATAPPPPETPAFWTACTSCCHLHQYDRVYEGKKLRCPNCTKAFRATPLPSSPPIVPGTNLYYCSWGFFPLGFAGAPGTQWKAFFPIDLRGSQAPVPRKDVEAPAPSKGVEAPAPRKDVKAPANVSAPIKATPSSSTKKKAVARKSVGGALRKKDLAPVATTRRSERLNAKPTAVIDVNQEAGSSRC